MEHEPSKKVGAASALMVHDNYSSNDEHDSQLFTSIPALSDAAAYLAQTTSYLTGCFTGSVEEAIPDDGQELVTFSEQGTFSEEGHKTSFDSCSPIFDHSCNAWASPSVGDNGETSSVGRPGDRSQALMSTSIFQNGSSIFQGFECSDYHFIKYMRQKIILTP